MTGHLEENVAREITDLCKRISEGSVTHVEMGMSLTRDLRFDPAKLMRFFSRLEELYAGLALEDWFVAHCADGRDTIGSVVRYIADTLPLAAAEFSYGSPQRDQPSDLPESISRPSRAGLQSGHSSEEDVRPRVRRAPEGAGTRNVRANQDAPSGLKPDDGDRP
jgi:hypothetical protein